MASATAVAHPNIALIKYWGNRDESLRLPQNGSISMNLASLVTRTTVTWEAAASLPADELMINGQAQVGEPLRRVSAHLDLIRELAGISLKAQVISESNFPTGAGIASSSSAFASLTLAASSAAGLILDERELSRLARRGSGSACRSITAGFSEWLLGSSDSDSYAISLFPPDHWALIDLVVIASTSHKATGSTQGHALASTSPLQEARVRDAPRRLDLCRQALHARNFPLIAGIIESDSMMMHSVMMTSDPPLYYWQVTTWQIMQSIREARLAGLNACCTVDAGPNVHVICEAASQSDTHNLLSAIAGIQEIKESPVGGPTRLV